MTEKPDAVTGLAILFLLIFGSAFAAYVVTGGLTHPYCRDVPEEVDPVYEAVYEMPDDEPFYVAFGEENVWTYWDGSWQVWEHNGVSNSTDFHEATVFVAEDSDTVRTIDVLATTESLRLIDFGRNPETLNRTVLAATFVEECES